MAWILKFYRPHRKAILGTGLLVLVSSLCTLPVPLLIRAILDRAIPAKDFRQLWFLVGGIVLLSILGSLLVFLETFLSSRINKRIKIQIQSTVYDHFQRMPLAFFTKHHSGKLLSRIVMDVSNLSPMMPGAILGLIKSVVTALFILVILLRIDLRLTLLILASSPVLFLIYNIVRRRIFKASVSLKKHQESLTALLQEDLKGSILTQSSGTEEFRKKYALNAITQAENANQGVVMLGAVANASSVVLTVAYAVVLWGYGGYESILSAITVGTLIAFAQYLGRIDGPMKNLSASNINIANSLASVQRLRDLLSVESNIRSAPGSPPLALTEGAISFSGVSFAFPDGKQIFSGLDLEIRGKRVTAIVGETGIGKTSLLQLIPRLHDVTGGSIRIDGQDIRALDLASLRKGIAVVHQDTFLFNASFRENLLMGRKDIDDEFLMQTCRSAEIHDYIRALPQGYESIIAENGANMSGGQRQRLALARAFLSQAPIILLDEFTSSLDSETERNFHPGLKNLFKGRTVIIITHNPSTLKLADHVICLSRSDGITVAEISDPENGPGAANGLMLESSLADKP